MLTPLSNLRSAVWMKQAIARFRVTIGRVNSVGGRLKPSHKWMIGGLLGMLLLACISVVAPAREPYSKNEEAPTPAADTAPNAEAPRTGAPQLHITEAGAAKSSAPTKEKSPEKERTSEKTEEGEMETAAASQQKATAAQVNPAVTEKDEEEDAEFLRTREEWC